jgi:hypothetical protein
MTFGTKVDSPDMEHVKNCFPLSRQEGKLVAVMSVTLQTLVTLFWSKSTSTELFTDVVVVFICHHHQSWEGSAA